MWHHDVRRHLEPPRSQRHRLAVIPASGRDQPLDVFRFTKQFRDINHRRASLERCDRSVVLMLHPHLGSQARAQQRPDNLRCWRHDRTHQLLRILDFVNRWQRRCNRGFCRHRNVITRKRHSCCAGGGVWLFDRPSTLSAQDGQVTSAFLSAISVKNAVKVWPQCLHKTSIVGSVIVFGLESKSAREPVLAPNTSKR